MAVITAIETQKKRPQRRSIYVEGRFVCGTDLEVVHRLGLREGQEIDEAGLRRLLDEEGFRAAMEYALRFLSFRPRSRREVIDRMKRRGHAEEMVSRVVAELERLKYLDDEQFTRQWVRSRVEHSPMGRWRLQGELARKGIPGDMAARTIKEEMAQVDEVELASSVLVRRMKAWQGLERREVWKRAGLFLQRRGFDFDTIGRVLRRVVGEAGGPAADG